MLRCLASSGCGAVGECNHMLNMSQTVRLAQVADAFFHVQHTPDSEIGTHMLSTGVDIIVDLMAHTTGEGWPRVRMGLGVRACVGSQVGIVGMAVVESWLRVEGVVADG